MFASMKVKLKIKQLIHERSHYFDEDGKMLDEVVIDDYADKINDELRNHIDELEPDFVLESVTHLGCWPCLIYDDDGRWAVSEEGNSNMATIMGEPVNYHQAVIVSDKKSWKGTIRDAVKYYILHYEEEEEEEKNDA